jgi:type IV pilus assembly protein PilX
MMARLDHLVGAGRRSRQTGASLLFALITLVALALAASALVRAVDTGAVVLGNLGSKKATAIAADRATQMAIQALAGMAAGAREADAANQGYYATSKEDYDITGFDRTDASRKLVNWEVDGACAYATSGTCDPLTRPSDEQTIDAAAGLKARWLITRLCSQAGTISAAANNCAVPLKGTFQKDQGSGEKSYSQIQQSISNPHPFFRIVVRVTGPRNAVTYTETIINFKGAT